MIDNETSVTVYRGCPSAELVRGPKGWRMEKARTPLGIMAIVTAKSSKIVSLHYKSFISSLCSHGVPWLGECLSMLLPHLPILRYPPPVVVQFVSPTVSRCPSVILYPADVPCPGPLPSSDLFNHVCDLGLSLTQMYISSSSFRLFPLGGVNDPNS